MVTNNQGWSLMQIRSQTIVLPVTRTPDTHILLVTHDSGSLISVVSLINDVWLKRASSISHRLQLVFPGLITKCFIWGESACLSGFVDILCIWRRMLCGKYCMFYIIYVFILAVGGDVMIVMSSGLSCLSYVTYYILLTLGMARCTVHLCTTFYIRLPGF